MLKVYNYGGICGFQLRVLIGTRSYATPNALAFQRNVPTSEGKTVVVKLSSQIFPRTNPFNVVPKLSVDRTPTHPVFWRCLLSPWLRNFLLGIEEKHHHF